MSLSDELFDSIAAPSLLAFHGEPVTYKPFGGSSVTTTAIVRRDPPEVSPESGRGRTFNVTIYLRNQVGVTSINTNGDRVSVAPTYGGTPQDLSVVEILNQSAAGWTLLLR